MRPEHDSKSGVIHYQDVPEPPCEVPNKCPHYERCGKLNLACPAFDWYQAPDEKFIHPTRRVRTPTHQIWRNIFLGEQKHYLANMPVE